MIFAGIVAGGTGSRMRSHANTPKQFLMLEDKPIIIWTIQKFLKIQKIDNIVIAINPDYHTKLDDLIKQYIPNGEKIYVIKGGKTRTESLDNIVKYCKAKFKGKDDILLTHDAVRPFVTEKIINDNIDMLSKVDACTTAIGSTDTILVSKNGTNVDASPSRGTMYSAQTPQSFRIDAYDQMMKKTKETDREACTDVCGLMMLAKKKVAIVEGDIINMKITYDTDLDIAKVLAKAF